MNIDRLRVCAGCCDRAESSLVRGADMCDPEEASGVTLTVRLVRSFEYRNFRPMVFQSVSLEQTVHDFIQHVLKDIETRSGLPPPFRKYHYDTMKIIHQAHGAKTNDLVMSLDDQDKPFLQENETLQAAGKIHR